jgi:N-acetylneuraminate synthase/sialic acid synthase
MLKKKELEVKPLIIAEVGQNHQGNLKLAKEYIEVFSKLGANAVKFQTRDNKTLFSEKAYNKTYDSENSFGETYGKHREKLEFNKKKLKELKNVCKEYKVKFISTPFDENSLDLLVDIGVDILKIASFDLGNLPLIEKIAKTKIPTILSTGGGNINQIKKSVNILSKYNSEISILHCVSEYPCAYDRLSLGKIKTLKKIFPKYNIGLSDHFNGILSGPLAYIMGARVFEKHVTMNRSWKGTDHKFSMEPEGFRKFARDISRVPEMLKITNQKSLGKEEVFKRLGKSVIASKDLKINHQININDLSGKIFDIQYTPIRDTYKIIKKKLKRNIKKGEVILLTDIK